MHRLLVVPRATVFCLVALRALVCGRVTARQLAHGLEATLELTLVGFGLRFAAKRMLRTAAMANDAVQASGELDGELSSELDRELVGTFARVARRHPLLPNCLYRSRALQRMLARRGVAAKLRIGVGRRPNLLPGHAWLEADGLVLNDDAEVVARYEPLVISSATLAISYSR